MPLTLPFWILACLVAIIGIHVGTSRRRAVRLAKEAEAYSQSFRNQVDVDAELIDAEFGVSKSVEKK